jgi:uncharacterized protein
MDTVDWDCYLKYAGDIYNTPQLQKLSQFEQHLKINRLQHIRSVAYLSFLISRKLKLDYVSTARAATMHDLFYYDWHDPDPSHRLHGYFHPGFALKNARELSRKNELTLSPLEENIIKRHMFPLTVIPPKFKEAILVCLVDKYVATKEIIICSSEKRSNAFFREVKGDKE